MSEDYEKATKNLDLALIFAGTIIVGSLIMFWIMFS